MSWPIQAQPLVNCSCSATQDQSVREAGWEECGVTGLSQCLVPFLSPNSHVCFMELSGRSASHGPIELPWSISHHLFLAVCPLPFSLFFKPPLLLTLLLLDFTLKELYSSFLLFPFLLLFLEHTQLLSYFLVWGPLSVTVILRLF